MKTKNALILGIGNILWADEGFGVRTVEKLNKEYTFDDTVRLMDGGTQGIYLVQHVEEVDILVVFDAIDFSLEPGTLKLIEGKDVPNYMGAKKMSLHQTGFQEVLAMSEMLGRFPEYLLLVGVQPVQLEDYGGSLRELTRQQMEPAIEAALAWLENHGVKAQKREIPLPQEHSLTGSEVNIGQYEQGRPSEEDACRFGDDRVLKSKAFRLKYKPHPLNPEKTISCDVDHRGKY